MSHPPSILKPFEVDRQLADDGDGSYCEWLCSRLDGQAAHFRRLMNTGLAADEFAQAGEFNDALAAAVSVVRSRWQSFRL
ncbi:MAG: hypothetical protein ABFC77_11660 [Thermoguttaceae bacterium]